MHRFAAVAAASIASFGFAPTAGATSSLTSDSQTTVEQADLLPLSGQRGGVEAFLVVWNGTANTVVIDDVTADGLGHIRLVRGPHPDREVSRSIARGLFVPPRSELLMKMSGVHLVARPGAEIPAPGGLVTVTVSFSDGSSQSIKAPVRSSSDQIKDHHHGS